MAVVVRRMGMALVRACVWEPLCVAGSCCCCRGCVGVDAASAASAAVAGSSGAGVLGGASRGSSHEKWGDA